MQLNQLYSGIWGAESDIKGVINSSLFMFRYQDIIRCNDKFENVFLMSKHITSITSTRRSFALDRTRDEVQYQVNKHTGTGTVDRCEIKYWRRTRSYICEINLRFTKTILMFLPDRFCLEKLVVKMRRYFKFGVFLQPISFDPMNKFGIPVLPLCQR